MRGGRLFISLLRVQRVMPQVHSPVMRLRPASPTPRPQRRKADPGIPMDLPESRRSSAESSSPAAASRPRNAPEGRESRGPPGPRASPQTKVELPAPKREPTFAGTRAPAARRNVSGGPQQLEATGNGLRHGPCSIVGRGNLEGGGKPDPVDR